MANLDLSQFTFKFVGYGIYRCTYRTAKRGDFYCGIIKDMTLIDATKNAEFPTQQALKQLRNAIKHLGSHFDKSGRFIDD